jgi:integrase
VLAKDIIPSIGGKRLDEVTGDDVQNIVARIKARGSPQVALRTRNVLKRLFDYAQDRRLVHVNHAALLKSRYIAVYKPRTRVLSRKEIRDLLEALNLSRSHPAYRIAVNLLLLTLTRKSELVNAQWAEIDFERREWIIPPSRTKQVRTHVVYLSRQAVELFEKLKPLSCGSGLVFPGRGSMVRPIHGSTLNRLVQAFGFTLHDFRRTASTYLHEAGFSSDAIEKALAHEQGGIRGIYNRAEYAEERRRMLQHWADFVDGLRGGNVVPLRA